MGVDLARVSVLLGRREAGPEVLTVPALRRERDSLVEEVKDVLRAGGGVVVYAFLEEEARSALMALQLALPVLRREVAPRTERPSGQRGGAGGASVQVFADPVELFMEPPAIGEETRVLIVHHAPRHPLLSQWVAEIPQGTVVVATGLVEEWEREDWAGLFGDLPTRWHRIAPDAPAGRWPAGAGFLRQRLAQDEGARRVFEWIAFFDALGVPCPLTLLGALTGLDGRQLERFTWDHADVVEIFRRGPGGERYCVTAGEALSRLVLLELWADRQAVEDRARQILQTASQGAFVASQDARYAVVRCLLGLIRKGYRDIAIRLCDDGTGRVQSLANQASPREVHLWAQLLQETYRFEAACAILEAQLDRADGQNRRYLCHALAVAYRRWAEATDIQNRRQELANRAATFLHGLPLGGRSGDPVAHERALAHFVSNPRGAIHDLEQEAQRRNNVYMWVSCANMMLRSIPVRMPDEAERALEAAERALGSQPPNDGRRLRIEHLRGRLALAQINFWGDQGMLTAQQAFQKAEDHFTKILAVDPYNLPALTELGRLAWQRGHRAKALHWLRRALRVDPANLIALMSLGKVYEDAGEWDEAEECYRRILTYHPQNLRALTALAALALRRGLHEETEVLLRQARTAEVEQGGPGPEETLEASENLYLLTVTAGLRRVQGRVVEAQMALERARRIADDLQNAAEPAVWVTLGQLLGREDAFARAENIARDRRDYYDYVLTRNVLAEWLLQQGRLSDAGSIVEATYQFDRDNVHTLRLLARVYRQSAREREAVEAERRASELEGGPVE